MKRILALLLSLVMLFPAVPSQNLHPKHPLLLPAVRQLLLRTVYLKTTHPA